MYLLDGIEEGQTQAGEIPAKSARVVMRVGRSENWLSGRHNSSGLRSNRLCQGIGSTKKEDVWQAVLVPA